MRVLITGAGGQLGRELLEAFDGHEVVGCDQGRLDVADRDQVLQMVGAVRPDTVVHAAAWTDVDGCERDPDRAFGVNAMGTRHICEAAQSVGARVCYISTDYVFDGSSSRPYTEWDQPRPLSAYGRSKFGGESTLAPGDILVRTSWLSGRHGRNFVKTVLAKLRGGETFDVVDDQHGCPTFADDLASMVRRLVVARVPGRFHVTNQGATTWFGLARAVASFAGADEDLLQPIAASDLQPPRPALRPPYAVLDNAALRLSGIPLLADYREPLERLVKELGT